jgi:archaellum biogenesis ATPase FlaH
MNPLERTILRQLFADLTFAERVVPYLKERYFHSTEAANVYKMFAKFFEQFHVAPQFVAVQIGLDADPTLNEAEAKAAAAVLDEVRNEQPLDVSQAPWILEQAELYCQDRAIHTGLQDCIAIMQDPKASNLTIPDIMKEALSVSFDQHIGHDYFADADERWDFYHAPMTRIPFDLDLLNKLTKGGVPRKTLNVILAGTNVGKSLALVHLAAAYLRQSKNVLYITCEMAAEWISERIDANMMDVPIDDVETMPKVDFLRKINHLRSTTTGVLKVKEYPTGTAHVGDFRAYLRELKLKCNFTPDVIVVDYLTICASSRIKLSHQSVNSYSYGKFIAEELRGLATEQDVPLWTAGQFNREGFSSSDPGLEHVGESFGIPQTADFTVALVTTDDLDKLGQIALIELKNRYAKRRTYQQHLLGMDTPRMKLYDLSAQQLAASMTLPTNSPAPSSPPPNGSFSARKKRPVLGSLKKENENNEHTVSP